MGFKTARQDAGKSVKEVADFMGVSEAAVYQWESGKYYPRPNKLAKLAKFYGCSVNKLLSYGYGENGGPDG